jgi:hypothetical protein
MGDVIFTRRFSVAAVNLLADFPEAYKTLIDNISGTTYYVSKDGNDTTGNGTLTNTYLTINKAIDVASNGDGVVILPGEYAEVNRETNEFTYSPLTSYMVLSNTKALTIIGAPGKVIWSEANNSGRRDNNILGVRNSNTNIYGIIFKRDNNGRLENYMTAIWSYEAVATTGNIYNCVFHEIGSNGRMSHTYTNGGGGQSNMYRCTIVASNWLGPYSCGNAITQNTALTSSNSFSLCGSTSNNTNGSSLGTNYFLTNKDNNTFGVYGGPYAWPQ